MRCPHCGGELEVGSIERLTAYNALTIQSSETELLSAEWGLTEPDWNNCVTIGFECLLCEKELPQDIQTKLHELLGGNE